MVDQASPEIIALVIDGKDVGKNYHTSKMGDYQYRIGKTETGLIVCDRKLLGTPESHAYEPVARHDIPLDLFKLPLFQ